jgi:hypothetical protein
MKNTILAGLIAVSVAVFAPAQPSHADAAAPTTCKDGTTSTSTGKGTCSGHGGIQKAASTTTAAPAAPAAPAAAAKTSTCKDGTTSTSTGKGTCSSHGGVQKPAATPAPAN